MTNYQRLALGTRTPWDAVVVTVRRALGRTVADVAAVEQIADFPMPVGQALQQAETIRSKLKLDRVVILLEDETLWRPEWGELRD